MKKLILLLLPFLGIFFASYGQVSSSIGPSIPPSPQSEAFKRFGEYSINYSTGVPDISIPLFEINHHGYKLPLSLKYFPSPLKPGYNYDVYGHGWGLSVNSSISRTVNFAPDEYGDFEVIEPVYNGLPFIFNLDLTLGYNNLKQYNYSHDDFNAILPDGSSFDFYIEKEWGDYKTYTSNGRSIIIKPIVENFILLRFEIIDEDGIKYIFSQGDYAPPLSGSELTYVAWHLTEIRLPQSPDPIIFAYEKVIQNISPLWEPSISFNGGVHDHIELPELVFNETQTSGILNNNSYGMLQLSAITYGSNPIYFNYAHTNTVSTHNFITSISTPLKAITLSMSEGRANSDYYAFPLMRLDTVTLSVAGSTPQKFICNYSVNNWFGNSTDHWGYLNLFGNDQVANFRFFGYIPYNYDEYYVDTDPYYITKVKLKTGDNNRNPSGDHQLLTNIIYPTGGSTEFEWERHRFKPHTDATGEYHSNCNENEPVEASGFRIAKISNYSEAGKVSDIKNFRYGKRLYYGDNSYHTGLGEPVVDPNILTYMDYRFDREYQTNFDFASTILGENFDIVGNVYNYNWECTFNASNFRRLLNGRPQVLYPEVTVYSGEPDDYFGLADNTLGKTVYKYDIYDENGLFFERPEYIGNILTYHPKSNRYNRLIEKSDYKRTGMNYQIIKREKNTWYDKPQPSRGARIFSKNKQDYWYDLWNPPYYYDRCNPYNCFKNKNSPIFSSQLMSKEICTFTSSGDSIKILEDYSYNYSDQLSSKTVTNNSNSLIYNYKYPNDYYVNVPAIIDVMKIKNIISPITEDSISNTSGSVISGNKTDFSEFGNPSIIMPRKKYELEVKPSGNNYILTDEIKSYSPNGNPLELVSKNGISTCYIWGYGDRYLVANIVNASFNANGNGDILSGANTFLKSKIDAINNETDNSALLIKLNEIRTALPLATVTTYTYKPLIGMTSQTDPNGVTTNYEYDGFGRLKTVLDNDNKVTEHYKYNYAAGPSLSISTHAKNFNFDGGAETITVTSNTSWTVSSNQSWLTVSPSSGTNDGSFVITCAQNPGNYRSATVTITAGTVQERIYINQNYCFSISLNNKTFDASGGSEIISVTSLTNWTVSSDKSWLTVSPTTGSYSGSFTITCEENTGLSRSGIITVTGGGMSCSLYVYQEPSDFNIVAVSSPHLVGPYTNPMMDASFLSFYYSIPPYSLYYNEYVNIQSIQDPEPIGFLIQYDYEYDWLDFYYDEQTKQLTFWATRMPSQTDYAVVNVLSSSLGKWKAFSVKIGY